jgi:hexosaminidase
LWTEHVPGNALVEAMALPRAAALAEIGWTAADRRDWPGFVRRMPAMWARYRALGLQADDGAMAVQAETRRDGAAARVALSRQLDLGAIRYTTDGSAPNAASPAYAAPFAMALPGRLRAATFAGDQRLSRELDLPLDAVSVTRRVSQQLPTCSGQIVLNLPGRAAARGEAGPA